MGHDGSESALARVGRLAVGVVAVVVVVVVPDVGSSAFGEPLGGVTFDPQRLLMEARELPCGRECETIETRAATGDPAVVLVDVAREVGADLQIVGRRGGDFVTRTLLGSVAQRVVQQAPCDVQVVRRSVTSRTAGRRPSACGILPTADQ